MKNTILTATAVIATTAAIVLYLKRKRAANEKPVPAHKAAHHLTKIFAKAKERSLNM